MRIYLLFALLLLTGLTACHRDKTPAPKQYSTWIVNNHDTFTTNNVDSNVACNPDHSYCDAGLASSGTQNWFTFGFRLSYLPTAGTWVLGAPNDDPNPNYVYFGFYYNSIFYLAATPHQAVLYASVQDNKITYTLPPTWFVVYNNDQDSILVEGVFNVP